MLCTVSEKSIRAPLSLALSSAAVLIAKQLCEANE